MSDAVLMDITDGITRVRLNRPRRVNAPNDDLLIDLNESLLHVELDASVKVVTLGAEGRAFIAGGDVSWWSPPASRTTSATTSGHSTPRA